MCFLHMVRTSSSGGGSVAIVLPAFIIVNCWNAQRLVPFCTGLDTGWDGGSGSPSARIRMRPTTRLLAKWAGIIGQCELSDCEPLAGTSR